MANLIGGGADQVSTNGMLGTAAFVDVDQLPIPGSIMTALAAKQDTLVSGTNIKTVNGTSLLGSGNVSISGGGALVLLATITPTASANIDALNVFNSTYDDYLIVGNGINFAANDSVYIRLATAGAADSGNNYIQASVDGQSTAVVNGVYVSINLISAGSGATFRVYVQNANSASTTKVLDCYGMGQSSVTPAFTRTTYRAAYFAANTASGFRLFANAGSNFSAQGSIKVYGIAKV